MKQPCRVSLLILSVLAIVAGVLLNSRSPTDKSAGPSLNKAAVGPDTPYIVLGMGCFWGAEKRMQALTGVLNVEAGYAGGDIPEPSYRTLHDTEKAIRNGQAIKNHAEVVKVYYDPKQTTLEQVLIRFWENHNPTQGNRQGSDIGSNYRSAIFYRTDQERQSAEKTRTIYQDNLKAAGIAAPITTEIAPLKNYASAEQYHQDYLAKNPLGYCGLGGTGIAYHDPDRAGLGENLHTPQTISPGQDWRHINLNSEEQIIVFEAVECGYCEQFDKEVLSTWKSPIPIVSTYSIAPPDGWKLNRALFATPTIVLFRNRHEVARYTGYQGAQHFREWLNGATANN
jgi:peptide methionine sulfoxide reductase msrA/msrB